MDDARHPILPLPELERHFERTRLEDEHITTAYECIWPETRFPARREAGQGARTGVVFHGLGDQPRQAVGG